MFSLSHASNYRTEIERRTEREEGKVMSDHSVELADHTQLRAQCLGLEQVAIGIRDR